MWMEVHSVFPLVMALVHGHCLVIHLTFMDK